MLSSVTAADVACRGTVVDTKADFMTNSSPASSAYRGEISMANEDRVLVLDFGSQTAQLIARRVREQHVFCQMVRHDLSAERIRELNPKGLILSGGPMSV